MTVEAASVILMVGGYIRQEVLPDLAEFFDSFFLDIDDRLRQTLVNQNQLNASIDLTNDTVSNFVSYLCNSKQFSLSSNTGNMEDKTYNFIPNKSEENTISSPSHLTCNIDKTEKLCCDCDEKLEKVLSSFLNNPVEQLSKKCENGFKEVLQELHKIDKKLSYSH
ncbi:hypothetical protein CROQUDRAFT_137152 [Cronartium quercuum f. sp. fusiforme G11]|uniref:Uncharacterized protein n=1 Tax=Cronartium quercuum f. sp. fusiforme G11 TaxID=708437 RepID=A0A9P6N8Z4_9BASI|nr:hypothetical protein CROQUDRAFT_137152 [Cronartium quercuum f. sp. fusiforme G11]